MKKILASATAANGLFESITTSVLRATSAHPTTLVSLLLATLVLAACGGSSSSSSSGGGSGTAVTGSVVITDPVGNVTVFPDDGAVGYTLKITGPNPVPSAKSLHVTMSRTGDCKVTPTDVIEMGYDENNQATANFNVTYTGIKTEGGSCGVNFAVNEDGQTKNLQRTVTFKAEKPPSLVASLIGSTAGDSTNVPANQQVRVNIIATKQDASNTTAVSFLDMVTSSVGCVATLVSETHQYNGVIAGTSFATAAYDVSPHSPDAVSECGTFIFNVTEGSATENVDFSETISFDLNGFFLDTDGDNIVNGLDNCPMIVNPGQGDINNDGEGDACDTDIDGDDIVNSRDNCLSIANQDQSDLNGDGEGDVCDNNDGDVVITDPVGNVVGFPDDGAVSYTLNLAKQNLALTTISLNVTPTITGTCNITPAGVTPLTYNANNQAITDFVVTYTGIATDGGSCVVDFAVIELTNIGTLTRNLQRTVTFNAEQAPTLVAELIGNGRNIAESIPVRVNVTATKQDGGNAPAVTFPVSVVSSGTSSCTATLVGAASKQYVIGAGISTAVVTYNVSPTNPGADTNCGTFSFNAIEGSATGSTDFSDPLIFLMDRDSDGIADRIDNCLSIANQDQSDLNGDGEGDVCDNNDGDVVITDPVGNVAGFPDDGAVSYTLNLAKQNLALTTISLDVTPAITGNCNITPAGVTPLTYNANNQATTSFNITYTGIATDGGSCVVDFVVDEFTNIGLLTRNLQRTVTFNAEQTPNLVAELIGTGVDVDSVESVRVELTATKQDDSNTTAVTFRESVTSAACTATLDFSASAGSTIRQYGGVTAGASVSAIYNISPTISGAVSNCGNFIFTAIEGSATGSTDFSGFISFVFVDDDVDGIADGADNCLGVANQDQSDTDNDGEGDACDADVDGDGIANDLDNCPMLANQGQSDLDGNGQGDVCDTISDNDADGVVDAMDVDVDGDGLIELHTAAQLNMMRYNRHGTGLDDGTTDNDDIAGGNSMGCGGGLTGITTCNGYEQMADIDLNDLPKDAAGSNWVPVGKCGNSVDCGREGDLGLGERGVRTALFNGIFSGNDFIISNLLINVITERFGVGFFGAISSTSELRNVHIRGGNITLLGSEFRSGIASRFVGGLVGFGQSATIRASSATLTEIRGTPLYVGGLVGRGDSAIISSSVATVGSISGKDYVGGLVGDGIIAKIGSSVATVGSISGDDYVGGLVGGGAFATIGSSLATVGSISGDDYVGGLVGDGGAFATIGSSLVLTNSINGSSNVGALVGFVDSPSVTVSYWDSIVTLTPASGNTVGSERTTNSLQNENDFFATPGSSTSIYATWGSAWCDPATGVFTTNSNNPLASDANRVWDLGGPIKYPAITCVANFFPLAAQREASRRALAGELPLVD